MKTLIMDGRVIVCPCDCENITANTPRIEAALGGADVTLRFASGDAEVLTLSEAYAWLDALTEALIQLETYYERR